MEQEVNRRIQMVEKCAQFFDNYQPLFINDENLNKELECFRSSFKAFDIRYNEVQNNFDPEVSASKGQKEQYAKQVFKVAAFLNVWAEENENLEVIKLTEASLSKFKSLSCNDLMQYGTQYKKLCVLHQEELESQGFNKKMLVNLDETMQKLQNQCVITQMNKEDKTYIEHLEITEKCLTKLDQIIVPYQTIYLGVCEEYMQIRQLIVCA